MEEKKQINYSQILTIVLIIVIVGIIGIIAYIGFNALKDKKTKDTYTEAANNFEIRGDISTNTNIATNALEEANITPDNEKETLEGYEILGTITIPKVDLKCPILAEVTPRTLEIAVAQMFTTSGLNKPGNTVIYGHNYRNALFFSRNDELNNGDKIYIVDQSKNKVELIVRSMPELLKKQKENAK